MPEFDKTNTLTINTNDKGDNDKRPDFKGDLNINGVRYFASLWQKDGPHGPFLSGPVEKADDKYQPNGAGARGGGSEKVSDEAGDKPKYF